MARENARQQLEESENADKHTPVVNDGPKNK